MEATKRIMVLLTLALLTAGSVQAAEPAAKLSGTRTASCLVKVTCDPAVLPLSFETIDYLLHSSAVGRKAARQVLSISPDQVQDLFTIEYVHELTSKAAPKSSSGGSSGFEEGGMDEYEYAMMMEADYRRDRDRYRPSRVEQTPPTSSSRRSRSSSRRGAGSTDWPGASRDRRTRTTGRTGAGTPGLLVPEGTYLFSLDVQLPEEVKPAAKEFMNALVNNLRQALTDAYHAYRQELQIMLEFAESQRDHAQSQLSKAMEQARATAPAPTVKQNPANVAVYERLEKTVDLPALQPQSSFADVIAALKHSVAPSLQIQPNWKDLLETAEVEPTTPAEMGPLTGVKVRKALEILLASVSSEFAQLNYVVDEGVILIATIETLPSKMETRVYEIPALAYSAGAARELVDAIQTTIAPESWYDASDTGEGTISVYLGKKLAILQTPEIHQSIQEFLRSMTTDIPVGIPLEVPTEMLLSEKYDLLREKQNLEMEVARLEARPPAVEDQIRRTKKEIDEKIHTDPVSSELEKILALQAQHLEAVKKLVQDGRASTSALAEAEEKLARAKIELARHREQIGASAGATQLAKFSHELATLTIDLAEKKAMLGVINDQLSQTEQHLMVATVSDSQVTRIRQATTVLEGADRRVNELNNRTVDLQPPTVSVIGGD